MRDNCFQAIAPFVGGKVQRLAPVLVSQFVAQLFHERLCQLGVSHRRAARQAAEVAIQSGSQALEPACLQSLIPRRDDIAKI